MANNAFEYTGNLDFTGPDSFEYTVTDTGDPAGSVGNALTTLPVTIDINVTGDRDGDGVADDIDNCPDFFNPDQTDTDNDGIGNRCDADFDNSGFVNLSTWSTFNPISSQ